MVFFQLIENYTLNMYIYCYHYVGCEIHTNVFNNFTTHRIENVNKVSMRNLSILINLI